MCMFNLTNMKDDLKQDQYNEIYLFNTKEQNKTENLKEKVIFENIEKLLNEH